MVSRSQRALINPTTLDKGSLQLILAHIIVHAEHRLKIFLHPLMIGGFFIALAWMGVFSAFYPWAHLVLLAVFVAYFCREVGKAHEQWKPVADGQARRRVEQATGLKHRPLDVASDRPVSADVASSLLWQEHHKRMLDQTRSMRWPTWTLKLAARDPYRLRYVMLVALVLGLVFGWGGLGQRIVAAINPAVAKWTMAKPALDAWITPPASTHLPPIMIATPAGLRHEGEIIDVPQGSTLSVHLAEKEGAVPSLSINDSQQDFIAEDQKDYSASAEIMNGEKIAIHRGWQKLGSWKIRVIADQPPQISLTEQPSVSERKSIRLSIKANDDYGIAKLSLHVTPHQSLPGYDMQPMDIGLADGLSKDVKRVSYVDLTADPLAGMSVGLQVVATDTAGHQTSTPPIDFALPEREFFNPLARALIEERKKLLASPFDDNVRTEVANVMAGIAHQPKTYRGDPVILMALRTGAVRLVLDHDHEAAPDINAVLWRTAVRIEDGNANMAEENLRQAQKDFADALDRNASEAEIQKLVDRMHQALAQYIAQLSMQAAGRPGPVESLNDELGMQNNVMSPDDLQKMVDNLRHLSATGSKDAARAELNRLQQLLENLHTKPVSLSHEQQAQLQTLKDLRDLIQDQQKLLDQTYQASNGGRSDHLSSAQKELHKRLDGLSSKLQDNAEAKPKLGHSADAMRRAEDDLAQKNIRVAVAPQNEALKAMKEIAQGMQEDLRQSLFMMPRPGQDASGGQDQLAQDDDSVKVPEQMEVRRVRAILDELQRRAGDLTRPKTERDYLDRLLQNF